LSAARAAFTNAKGGLAAQYSPAQLARGREMLEQAEQAFKHDPEAQRTKDLAYIALRKIELARIQGHTLYEQTRLEQARRDLQLSTQGALASARRELEAAERDKMTSQMQQQFDAERSQASAELDKTQQQLQTEREARFEAETRAQLAKEQIAAAEAKAQETANRLAELGTVKKDERGTVLTLSGTLLFSSGQATLLPSAQLKLNEVADALKESNNTFLIEGHTDGKGSDGFNQELSRRRAEAVREYLASRGVNSDKMRTVGLGESRPIADNATSEGRANNRRVEIVLQSPPRGTDTGVGGSGMPEKVPDDASRLEK